MYEFSEQENMKRFESGAGEYKFQINGQNVDNFNEKIKERAESEQQKAMEKYMPIGSVVKLYDYENLVMIIGFKNLCNDVVYDYVACDYPFGVQAGKKMVSFNHNQIHQMFHIGYVNEQEKFFKEQLDLETPNEYGRESEFRRGR